MELIVAAECIKRISFFRCVRYNERSPQRAILCGFSRLGIVARARFPTVCGKKERTITRSVVSEENLYLSAKDLSRKAFPIGSGENFMKKDRVSFRKRGKYFLSDPYRLQFDPSERNAVVGYSLEIGVFRVEPQRVLRV